MKLRHHVQRLAEAAPQLHDYLLASARRRPDKVALVSDGARLTYAEIDARSNALAHALAGRGIEPGDRVVVFADNSIEAVVAFWGILKANAIVSIVSPLTKADKLAHLLNDCGATALITHVRHEPVFDAAVRRAPALRTVLVAGLRPQAGAGSDGGPVRDGLPYLASWDDALGNENGGQPPPRRNLDIDLAAIIYTSGSTGEPKGIMLTHRNMLAAATSITAYLGTSEDDVVFDALPMSFDYGLYQVIMAFRVSARVVLARSFAFPTEALKTVVNEGVTTFPGVPTIFATMAGMSNLAQFDFSGVRTVTNTAAALSANHIAFLKRTFPGARIFSMYGLTECKRCTYLPPEDLDRKPSSVGVAIPNTEIWLEDEHGRRLGPGQAGQLVVRGATVMRGYWGKPEATARRLKPGPLPGEMVLHTGDACRMDEEGYLYFVGRMDEVIKSRGEKVAPEEVERALAAIDGVREAGVVGVPDEILGHAVKAFVVLHPGSALTEQAVKVECQRRLESFMVPKYVDFVSTLPRTTTGKVDRTQLR